MAARRTLAGGGERVRDGPEVPLPRGARACVRRATFIRGQRYSVLPALTSEGYIALDIFEGSVNKERFIRFLEEQLVCAQNTILVAVTHIYYGPHNSLPTLDHGVL